MAKTDTKSGAAAFPDRRIAWILLAATLLLYLQTAGFGFINLDDPIFITENEHVRAGLTGSSIWWALTTGYINWQPLVYLSHMAVVTVFGLDPAAHHLLNALLHAANAALFFLVLRRMRLPVWPSAAAAAVFALHPLRIESVAWASERKDVLSSLFWLLTMWAYVGYTEAPKDRRRYAMVVLYFVLGLMSKPMLVTMPVALLILDFWPLERWKTVPLSKLILEKVPLGVLAFVVAIATIVTQQAAGAMATTRSLPIDLRLSNIVRSYAIYIWKTLWPVDLAVIYPFPDAYPAIEIVASVALLAGISYLVWVRRIASPWWLAGWLWYILVAAPTIGIIQVGPQPYADRYTYLPSLLPLAAAAVFAARKLSDSIFRMTAIGLAAVLALASWVQLGVWKDDFTLYRHAIAAAPGASVVYLNLGVALEKIGRYNEAIANYKLAQELNPGDANAVLNTGLAYLLSGRPEEALTPLARAVEMQPASPGARMHYGRALMAADRLDDAAASFRQALTLAPPTGMAAALHVQLGLISYMRKNDAAALAEFMEALKIEPSDLSARKNAGIALGNMGRNREAIEQLEMYLQSNPGDKDVAAAIGALRTAR